ncbi:MAG: hypothetical protein EXS13_13430 [Planctomycetes bacterium]|nr:hypothetical protein [Planctomycetota bacterium]
MAARLGLVSGRSQQATAQIAGSSFGAAHGVPVLRAALGSDPHSTFNWNQDTIMAIATEPQLTQFRPLLDQCQQFDASWRVVGRLLDGEEERASFEVTMFLDQRVEVWAGVETTRIEGWERLDPSKPAADAPVRPRVTPLIDGLALLFRLTPDQGDGLVLQVTSKVHLLTAPPEPLCPADGFVVDRVHARTLHVCEPCRLPATGGSVRLGGDVRLELNVIRSSR